MKLWNWDTLNFYFVLINVAVFILWAVDCRIVWILPNLRHLGINKEIGKRNDNLGHDLNWARFFLNDILFLVCCFWTNLTIFKLVIVALSIDSTCSWWHAHARFYELDGLLWFSALIWIIFYFHWGVRSYSARRWCLYILNRLLISSCWWFHYALCCLLRRFVLRLPRLGCVGRGWRQGTFLRCYFHWGRVHVSNWWSFLLTTCTFLLTFKHVVLSWDGRLHRRSFLFWR